MFFIASRQAGDSTTSPVVITFAVGGSATFGTDYTVTGATSFSTTTGSLTIPVGQTSASLTCSLLLLSTPQPQKAIVLTPQPQSGLWRSGSVTWTGIILADDTFYRYTSAAFANTETVPKGIFWLLGSENNTAAFSNPTPAKVGTFYRTETGSYTDINLPDFADRTLNVTVTVKTVAFDFKVNRIKVGTVGVYTLGAGSNTIAIYGSNTATNLDYINTANASLWTSLGSVTGYSAGWVLINSSNLTKWRYLKLEMNTSPDFQFNEVEFYNSTIYSPYLNLNLDAYSTFQVLNCKFDGISGSTTFTDDFGATIVRAGSGNTAITTAKANNGSGSLYIDNTPLVITSAVGSDNYTFAGQYTVQMWLYLDTGVTIPAGGVDLFCRADNVFGRSTEYSFKLISPTSIGMYYGVRGSSQVQRNAAIPALNIGWNHLAYTRDSNNVMRFFANGVVGTGSDAAVADTTTLGHSANQCYIGGFFPPYGLAQGLYLDSLVIHKGACLYTGNFTPPTFAL